MKKIASFIKAVRLKQIAIVFFAGVMLLLNTACSNAAQAKVPMGNSLSGSDPHPVNQTQPYEGGMNNYSDTPPGQIPTGKAKTLVDNAKRNITSNDPRDADPRNAKLYKNPGYAAERTKDTLGNAVNSRADNAKQEAKKVGDRIGESGERAVEKAKELGQRVQKSAGNVADNVGNSVVGAGEDTKFKAKEARKTLNETVKDVID